MYCQGEDLKKIVTVDWVSILNRDGLITEFFKQYVLYKKSEWSTRALVFRVSNFKLENKMSQISGQTQCYSSNSFSKFQ